MTRSLRAAASTSRVTGSVPAIHASAPVTSGRSSLAVSFRRNGLTRTARPPLSDALRGSGNGTSVNGERVEKSRLREGDKVAVGEAVIRVEALRASEAPPSAATTRDLKGAAAEPVESAVAFIAESPEAKRCLRLIEKA